MRRTEEQRWLTEVAHALRGLEDEYALVGACTAATYPLGALDVRPTRDVDLLVRASSYLDWQQKGALLERRGFRPDPLGKHAAQYRLDSLPVPVDVLPTPWEGLGHNRWYAGAFAERERDPGTGIPAITPLWFLATKLEAWRDRGRGDPTTSHDLEDVITVLRGLEGVWSALAGPRDVQRFVRAELRSIAERPDALELVQGMIEGDEASQRGAAPLLARMRALAP